MKNSFKKITLQFSVALMSALVLAGCSGSKSGDTYSQIVVFGASLSDNGNAATVVPGLFPGAPYYPGRASNGLLWIDVVAADLGNEVKPFVNGGTNYAVGGARTCEISGTSPNPFDMCYQTNLYLAAVLNRADASALYVIDAATVGNNIFAHQQRPVAQRNHHHRAHRHRQNHGQALQSRRASIFSHQRARCWRNATRSRPAVASDRNRLVQRLQRHAEQRASQFPRLAQRCRRPLGRLQIRSSHHHRLHQHHRPLRRQPSSLRHARHLYLLG